MIGISPPAVTMDKITITLLASVVQSNGFTAALQKAKIKYHSDIMSIDEMIIILVVFIITGIS